MLLYEEVSARISEMIVQGMFRPGERMNLDVLDYVIRHNRINACITIANFNNPLGSLMPHEKKQELVALLAGHDIPLIEDDVYGDLAFGSARPSTAKAFDSKGPVFPKRIRCPSPYGLTLVIADEVLSNPWSQ